MSQYTSFSIYLCPKSKTWESFSLFQRDWRVITLWMFKIAKEWNSTWKEQIPLFLGWTFTLWHSERNEPSKMCDHSLEEWPRLQKVLFFEWHSQRNHSFGVNFNKIRVRFSLGCKTYVSIILHTSSILPVLLQKFQHMITACYKQHSSHMNNATYTRTLFSWMLTCMHQ